MIEENKTAVNPASEARETRPAEFQSLQPKDEAKTEVLQKKGDRLSQLMKVDIEAQVCLGKTMMKLSQAMALEPGAVVTLDHEVGQPVELLVNQKVFAQGEVVVIGEKFGLRITQLLGD